MSTSSTALTVRPDHFTQTFINGNVEASAASQISALIAENLPQILEEQQRDSSTNLDNRLVNLLSSQESFSFSASDLELVMQLTNEGLPSLLEGTEFRDLLNTGGTFPLVELGEGGTPLSLLQLPQSRAALAKWLGVPESNLGRQVNNLEKAIGLAVTAMAVSIVFAGVITAFNPSSLALWNTAIYQMGAVLPLGLLVAGICAYVAYHQLESADADALLKQQAPQLKAMLDTLEPKERALKESLEANVGETPETISPARAAMAQLKESRDHVKLDKLRVNMAFLREKLQVIAPELLAETPDDDADADEFF